MFNKKNDPLIDSVKAVMEHNEHLRRVEATVNEHFGVHSKAALPHELHAEYDAVLEESKNKPETPDHHKAMAIRAHKAIMAGDVSETTKNKKKAHEKAYKDMTGNKIKYPDTMSEKVEMTKKQFANLDGNPKFTGKDLALARAGHHKKKAAEGTLEEKKTDKASKIIGHEMRKFKAGELHSGKEGPVVTSRKHAVAIALNVARKKGGKVSPEKIAEAEEGVTTGDLSRMTAKDQAARAKPQGDMPKNKTKDTPNEWKTTVKDSKGETMNEDFETILEEIRNNLEEELVYVYENYDEETFMDYVNSLTEEQLEILQLHERVPPNIRSSGSSTNPNMNSPLAKPAGMGPPPAPKRMGPDTSHPAFRGTQQQKPPSPTPRTNVVATDAQRADAKKAAKASPSSQMPDGASRQTAGPTMRPTQRPAPGAAKPGMRPATGATKPGMRPAPGVPRTGTSPRTGKDGMTMAQRRAKYTPQERDGSLSSAVQSALRENSRAPVQVRESFEQFLRNRFLKG